MSTALARKERIGPESEAGDCRPEWSGSTAFPAERRIWQREGIGAVATVRQRRELYMARVAIDAPTIILVSRGSKTLVGEGWREVIHTDDAILLAAGVSYDIINSPDSDGLYEAAWFAFSPGLIAAPFPEESLTRPVEGQMALRSLPVGFVAAFERALGSMMAPETAPLPIMAQQARELLTWIALSGGRFLPAEAPPLPVRLRSMIAAAPEAEWKAPDLARALAMSEATLRRRLAAEGTSLGKLLTDVRMSRALTLLQVTDRPINWIAQEVGYDCASRFAARFRARFGFLPRAVRGERRVRTGDAPEVT
ncbi:helix-turn-helix transcriptional regulator [Radicibacter daui]|uniref:helix-turn-helix transcriptional regulator n=1 Tax=Radicibacter daui TaxID=3064829 RepID=UPI004046EF92